MLERCKTAREAIKLCGELLDDYGWNDYGECLTIADPKEVWHLEIKCIHRRVTNIILNNRLLFNDSRLNIDQTMGNC